MYTETQQINIASGEIDFQNQVTISISHASTETLKVLCLR